MATTNLNIRTDKDVKDSAERLFDQLGLNMTTAVNMFLRQAIRENRIPFDITLNVPNAVTVAAINEGRRLAKDENVKGYSDIDELRAALDEWNTKLNLQANLKKTLSKLRNSKIIDDVLVLVLTRLGSHSGFF